MYDGTNVVLVFDDSSSLTNRYLHGDLVDQIFADETATEVLWALTDNQGTVRDIANYDPTQDESTVLNHRKFDAYGNITAESNGSIEFRYAYTGRYFDEDSGLQYNRARWYDATVGRWISEDPIGFAAGDANISRYVTNSPTNFTDPSGLDPPGGSDAPSLFAPPPPPGYTYQFRPTGPFKAPWAYLNNVFPGPHPSFLTLNQMTDGQPPVSDLERKFEMAGLSTATADFHDIQVGMGHHWFLKGMVQGTTSVIPGLPATYKDAIWGLTTGDFHDGHIHNGQDHGKVRKIILDDFQKKYGKPNGQWDLDGLGKLNEFDAEKHVKNIMNGKTPIEGKPSGVIDDFNKTHIDGKVESRLRFKTLDEAVEQGRKWRNGAGFAAKSIWIINIYDLGKDYYLLKERAHESGRTVDEQREYEGKYKRFWNFILPAPNPLYRLDTYPGWESDPNFQE